MSEKHTLPRNIIHVDLDAFFCAVEELNDPSLRGQPFAVGGEPGQRGVVASCSYAARKFGIHSAMPMSRAVRLCPQLKIVHHSFKDYGRLSDQVMDLLANYTTLLQPISIDEAFMDISHLPDEPFDYAKQIQAEINNNLKLPASLGVATNKLVAKVATNVGKAAIKTGSYPNAIQVVPPGEEAAFLAPLPTDALWGVGPKTAEKLAELGLHTIGDVAAFPERQLERHFGQIGTYLHVRSQGIDESSVHVTYETKSVSHEWTYAKDTADERTLRATLHEQAQSVGRRLRKLELVSSTVKIKLRWPDFTTITRQLTLKKPTDDVRQIEAAAIELLIKHWKPGHKLRLIGVGVSKLGPPTQQLSIWDWNPKEFEKQQRLERALQKLQAKYGVASVQHASDLAKAG